MEPTDFFLAKLAFTTDPADLAAALESDGAAGTRSQIIVDTRTADAYRAGHLPGAVNLPHATITADLAPSLDPDARYVTYCWGPACNASTKGAANLAKLGFSVRELIGGLSAWEAEGFAIEVGGEVTPTRTDLHCGC